jgi:predicted metal-binding membrane protein
VACCWGLMAALFALGVMSTGWMALMAALIAAARLLPWKTIAGCGVAVALALLALGVAFAPEDVPGFRIPGSHQGEATMDSMQMP